MKKRRDGSFTEKARFTVGPDASIPGLLRDRARAHPTDIVVELRTEVGAVQPLSAIDLQSRVEEFSRGLIGIGVAPGESVAILSSTSFEWMLLDLAILSVGAITVPIYESDSAAQIRHILEDGAVSVVFTATSQQAELIESVRTDRIRWIHSIDRGDLRRLSEAARRITADEARARADALRGDAIATIIYTSGTTGAPKGVELTHANFVATIASVHQVVPKILDSTDTRLLVFLPLAHVLARFIMYMVLAYRGVLGFAPNIKTLVTDLQAFRPTALIVVPRVLEKVFNAAQAEAGHGFRRTVFGWSAKQARQWATAQKSALGPSPARRVRYRLADRLVLSKVKQALGGHLSLVVSGGAPLSSDLQLFVQGLGFTLIQGYGLSETTGPVLLERPDDNPPGAVGQVLAGNAVKISDEGEILLSGAAVMRGYRRLPEATAEALAGGWFHTGDLGTIDRKGIVRITGRKKELIVTAGGKNVSPEILEDALQSHPLIGQVIVVGEGRPYIGALIALDEEMLPSWLTAHGIQPVGIAAAGEIPSVRESLERAIAKANQQVSRAESIRRFRIIDAEFTVANGYLTPSLKLKRNIVLRDFGDEVDALYAEGEAERNGSNMDSRRSRRCRFRK